MAPSNSATKNWSVDVLLAEYEALYQLAEYRMTSLDRRVPAAGALLTTFVGLIPLIPDASGLVLLSVVPASLVWLIRTTINHARSLEDVLRGIESLDLSLNQIAGATLLTFQSQHPSRGRTVGGRTGRETVGAVAMAAALLLGSCLYLAFDVFDGLWHRPGYALYIAVIAGYAVTILIGWRRYRSSVSRSFSEPTPGAATR